MSIVRYFGLVSDLDRGVGVAGARVEAWDVDGALSDPVAIAVTGADGQFEMRIPRDEVDGLFAGRAAVVAFRIVSGTALLARTDCTHRWNLRGDARGRFDVDPTTPIGHTRTPPRLVVRGRLLDAVTGPIAGATVLAFDENVGPTGISETALGSDTTDARGRYRISFDSTSLGREGKQIPDLVVRALVNATKVAEERVRAASPITEIALIQNGTSYAGRGEHARLLEALDAHRGGVAWRLLDADQIALIAEGSRTHRKAVDSVAAAAQMADAVPAVPAEAFFGLLRHGLPSSRVLLLSHRPADLRKTLEKAIEAGTVSEALSASLDAIETALLDAAVTASFDARPDGVGLGTLVGRTPGVSAGLQQEFVRKALTHEGDSASFWASLDADAAFDGLVPHLRFTVEATPLVANHTAMLDYLHAVRSQGNANIPALHNPGDLDTPSDLGKLRLQDWQLAIETTGVPAGVTGQNEAEKKATYAAWITRTVEARFRTAVIAARITAAEPNGDLAAFFASHKAFAFEKKRVAHYLAEHPTALANAPVARARLLTLERLFPITRTYEQMAALETAGLTSAYAVHGKGKVRFLTEHAEAIGSEEEAKSIFGAACWVVSASSAMLGKYSTKLQIGLPALPDVHAPLQGLPPAIPDWATLFGEPGSCACDHCQSVWSASAYLVDLLQFLGKQPASAGSARDLLLARRPDIAHLELSCNASETPLPYVDLVHEILEIALVAGQWPTSTVKNLSAAEDLSAAPDVLYPDIRHSAYTVLANASHPFEAPFHVWAEEARIYLRHVGVPRHELIRVFAQSPAPAQLKPWIAAERLGLSLRQRDLIGGVAGGPSLPALWGYSENAVDFATNFTHVPTFMQKAGLTFEQLRELLATGLYSSLALPNNAGCDVSEMVWAEPSQGDLTQIHRFLRLRKALGWSITDLGDAVAKRGGLIDAAFVDEIATLDSVRGQLGMDVPTAVSLFADIDRNSAWSPSLFERLFLRRNVVNADEAAFAEVFTTPNGAPNPPRPLSEHRSGILAAVGGSDADLALVVDFEAAKGSLRLWPALAGTGAENLTLQSLSRIHRVFALARGAGLSVRDYLALQALHGEPLLPGDVESGGSPDKVEAFLDVVRRVRESKLSVAEIHYIARHVAGPEDTFVPTTAQLDLLLGELAKGVKAAAAEAGKPGQPTTAKAKSLFQQLLPEPDVVAVLISILDGTSGLEHSGQLQHIGAMLSGLVESVEDAKQRLVGLTENDPERLSTPDERYSYLARRLLRVEEGFLQHALSAALGLAPKVVERLTSIHLLPSPELSDRSALLDFMTGADPDAPHGSETARRNHLVRLHKAALLLGRLRFSADEALFLFPEDGQPPVAGLPWLDLASLPVSGPTEPPSLLNFPAGYEEYLSGAIDTFGHLLRFIDLAALRDLWPAGREALFAFLALAKTAQIADLRAALSEQMKLPSADITTLVARFCPNGAADLRSDVALARLNAARTLLQRLGASAEDAIRWTALDAPLPVLNGAEGAAGIAREIKQAVRAKYAAGAWSAVAKPLRDELRERQRKALVAAVAAQRGHDHASALYEDLLIDVEMSPCMMTSRTVQAVAAAQLFVQRSLLHLEQSAPGVPFTLGEEAAREWEWMKSYRVWEANRKVFLYPENWLEPELRDDKTPLFRAFESRLSQGPLTHEAAEKAFRSYLEELHEIAHLDIVALAEQDDAPDGSNTLAVPSPKKAVHLFGRTRSPSTYYYRSYSEGRFSPWEKIDIDLSDDYLIPVVHGGRLFLFWAIVSERGAQGSPGMMTMGMTDAQKEKKDFDADNKAKDEDEKGNISPRLPIPPATQEEPFPKRMSVSFAYVERQQGKFTKKRHAKDVSAELPLDIPPNEPVPPGALKPLFFLGRSDGAAITIDCCTWNKNNTADGPTFDYVRFAQLAFRPCTPIPEIVSHSGSGTIAVPKHTAPEGQGFFGSKDTWLVTGELGGDDYPSRVFADLATPFRLVAHRAEEGNAVRDHIVFKDPHRTFFLQRLVHIEELPASKWNKVSGIGGWVVGPQAGTVENTFADGRFRISTLYHPSACSFLTTLAKGGLDGLMRWQGQASPVQLAQTVISDDYHPDPEAIEAPFPVEEVDFSPGGAYSTYNWEIFFHAPLLIAARLDVEQRYDEADRWYRYIFDPTDGSPEPSPARYWKVRPFYENQNVSDLLADLTAESANAYAAQMGSLVTKQFGTKASDDFASQVSVWRQDPFNPYAIARTRPIAFQKATVLRYIDHLLKWGDKLFRRDTRESVAEATQLYVFAKNLLGPRPTVVKNPNPPEPQTYNDLLQSVDAFSNALVNVESVVPPPPVWGAGCGAGPSSPTSVWGTLYFCLPPNDKLLGLWDVVEDRLFKIRHCMNIEGTRRELALFDPPIDPAILVRARAAGVDIDSVLGDLYAPAPVYRFSLLHGRAMELTGYLTSLGAGLLSAIEKRDAERLAMLRTNHEIQLAQAVREVKKRQIDEAEEQVSALERSRAVVEERRRFYADIPKRIEPERQQFTNIDMATGFQVAAQSVNGIAASMGAIPDTWTIALPPAGAGGSVEIPGGSFTYRIAQLIGAGLSATSHMYSQEATKSGIEAGYQRREAEWNLQKTLAEREIAQMDKQLAAARIRVAIAEHDLDVHERAMDQMREVREHLQDKFTNEELYDWLVGQTSGLYFQAYQLAYQMAKRAERAYRYERGDQNDTFIGFEAWDSLRRGLLAGERLSLDLRRMESAYLEKNRREYEITKHVSLASHAPEELLRLRETGEADIRLSEADYDRDHPSHYMRRIKTASITVPCVTGPYQGVHGKLTLLHGESRISPTGDVFEATRGAIQSIITSSGQNDPGMFELALRDDRLLPFEGAGAHAASGSSGGNFRFELPPHHNRFDFDSISDLILTLRYTARDGRLPGNVAPFTGKRLFSAKQDFPDAWQAFVESNSQDLELAFATRMFARPHAKKTVQMTKVQLYTKRADGAAISNLSISCTRGAANVAVDVADAAPIGQLHGVETVTLQSSPPQTWTVSVTGASLAHADLADLWIIVDYTAS